jgi:hypothetical protein
VSDGSPRRGLDLGLALLVVGLAAYVAVFADFGAPPAEDAAMLLRYSEHLAEGKGIVWNVGEKPLDGATDFLFMLGVAGLDAAGLGAKEAAQWLGLLAHVLTVVLVYLAARRLFGAPALVALAAAGFLAVGPGLYFVEIAFGTTFFALTVAVSWVLAHHLARAEPDRLRSAAVLFGLSGVVMGMARPEGVFVSAFFLAAVLVLRGGKDARTVVIGYAIPFLTLGLAYFIWRWSYFGHPLPNPFYKKSAGELHLGALRKTVRNVVLQGGPFLALLVAGLAARSSRRWAVAGLVPVAGFAAMWVLVSDETVEFIRYGYTILPVIVLAWIPVVLAWDRARWPGIRRVPRAVGLAAGGLAVGALLFWQHARFAHLVPSRIGLYDVALALREYEPRGYTMVVTEAGLLPLYSRWRAVDAWGLNDRWIARHGPVTEEYLVRYRPEVILAHAYFSPGVPQEGEKVESRGFGKEWYLMVRTLQRFAEARGYVLAAVIGRNTYDTHYYYVRADCPDAAEIIRRIRETPYLWDGQPTGNYAP